MPDQTTILSLPYILPAQAQKHVTHNEALRVLDVLVQLGVQDRNRTIAPSAPPAGARHIVAAGASGDWTGKSGQIAVWEGNAWAFFAPLPGWRAHIETEGVDASFDGTVWVSAAERPLQVTQLGVSASPDATNRLSVSSPASLLNHAGAGHQIKVNKAAATDTAALLFQTNFSGRAEMGTTGSDDFVIKVSPDGTTFNDGVVIARSTGIATLPRGVRLPAGTALAPAVSFSADPDTGISNPAANQIGFAVGGVQRVLLSGTTLDVSGLITGTAVTQARDDTTANRLLKVGDFGIGGVSAAATLSNIDSYTSPIGVFTSSNVSTAGTLLTGSTGADTLLNLHCSPNQTTQIVSVSNAAGHLWHRRSTGSTSWNPWRRLYDFSNVLGTVSQTAGVPTGALIESGSNANGFFTRFASGMMICRNSLTMSAGAAVTWTFPSVFAEAPTVTGTAIGTVLSAVMQDTVATTTTVALSARDAASARRADVVHLVAIGRWSLMT